MQPSFFDHQNRLELLERLGDPLPKLERTIQWEAFRELLSAVYKDSDPRKGGRPPFDAVLMFKVPVLQHFYNLSDDQTEFQIRDRYSFCRFLGLSPEGRADSAYRDTAREEALPKANYRSKIHRKGSRKRPLNEREQAANRKRSKIRARVEHVFAQQADRLIRTIGKARAEVKIGLMNVVYNLRRLAWLAG
jgi:hypothetical protein